MSSIDPIIIREEVLPPDAEIVLVIPTDLRYLKGHFPGVPVVPGVVQVKWAFELADRCLGVSGEFKGMEALKFQHLMPPGIEVKLSLKFVKETRKLHFAFNSEHGRHSTGRLLLDRIE